MRSGMNSTQRKTSNMDETVEIFRLNLFGLDAYLIQPEENKKYPERGRLIFI